MRSHLFRVSSGRPLSAIFSKGNEILDLPNRREKKNASISSGVCLFQSVSLTHDSNARINPVTDILSEGPSRNQEVNRWNTPACSNPAVVDKQTVHLFAIIRSETKAIRSISDRLASFSNQVSNFSGCWSIKKLTDCWNVASLLLAFDNILFISSEAMLFSLLLIFEIILLVNDIHNILL